LQFSSTIQKYNAAPARAALARERACARCLDVGIRRGSRRNLRARVPGSLGFVLSGDFPLHRRRALLSDGPRPAARALHASRHDELQLREHPFAYPPFSLYFADSSTTPTPLGPDQHLSIRSAGRQHADGRCVPACRSRAHAVTHLGYRRHIHLRDASRRSSG